MCVCLCVYACIHSREQHGSSVAQGYRQATWQQCCSELLGGKAIVDALVCGCLLALYELLAGRAALALALLDFLLLALLDFALLAFLVLL